MEDITGRNGDGQPKSVWRWIGEKIVDSFCANLGAWLAAGLVAVVTGVALLLATRLTDIIMSEAFCYVGSTLVVIGALYLFAMGHIAVVVRKRAEGRIAGAEKDAKVRVEKAERTVKLTEHRCKILNRDAMLAEKFSGHMRILHDELEAEVQWLMKDKGMQEGYIQWPSNIRHLRRILRELDKEDG